LRSLQRSIKTRQLKSIVALDLKTGEKLDLSPISPSQSSNRLSDSRTPTLDLPEEFADFADVFSKTSADKLPEHTEYDHTLPLEPGTKPPFRTIYPLSAIELKALDEYLKDTEVKTSRRGVEPLKRLRKLSLEPKNPKP
jgi:hypothetical protein